MNCSRCQYDLSQCLDGRLGSGRRAVVMRHVAECPTCAGFWEELQRARELVIDLPPERVSADFRSRLWERIRSGEGTPEAVFREPVPLSSKVRYVLSGAAAAAAVLLAIYIAAPPDRGAQRAEDVARRGAPAPPAVAEATDAEAGVIPVQLSPPLLAQTAAQNLQANYLDLSRDVQRLDSLVSRAGTESELDRQVREICDRALEVKSLGALLVALESDNFVQFSPNVGQELRFFNAYLDDRQLRRRPTVEVVRAKVVPVVNQARTLAHLQNGMTILLRPERQQRELQQLVDRLYEFARQYPEGLKHIPLQIPRHDVMSCDVVPEFQMPGGAFLFEAPPPVTWNRFRQETLQPGIHMFANVRVSNGVRVLELRMGNGQQPKALGVIQVETVEENK